MPSAGSAEIPTSHSGSPTYDFTESNADDIAMEGYDPKAETPTTYFLPLAIEDINAVGNQETNTMVDLEMVDSSLPESENESSETASQSSESRTISSNPKSETFPSTSENAMDTAEDPLSQHCLRTALLAVPSTQRTL
jgi:hypothetical protein